MHPFSHDLLSWYDRHGRKLPWRGENLDPYRIWLSEVMCQQTRVETVLPYYARFCERFPRVEDLAAAPLDEVLAMWSGLGYYSRARNMHRAAQLVVELGGFPRTLEGLRSLPGVGEYMAAAVASIALGLPEPAIDGNLERVLARVHAHPGGRRQVLDLGRALIPQGRPGDFNQALMDLGSAICIPRNPRCRACPVARHCAALAAGEPEAFPRSKPKKAVPERKAVAAAIERDGRLLLARLPPEGLFGGLYELPGGFTEGDAEPGEALRQLLRERLQLEAEPGRLLGEVQHTLTHMRLRLQVIAATIIAEPEPRHYTAIAWVDPADPAALSGLGLSTLARKSLAVATSRQQALFQSQR